MLTIVAGAKAFFLIEEHEKGRNQTISRKKNSQAILDISVIVYDEETQYKLQKLMQMV